MFELVFEVACVVHVFAQGRDHSRLIELGPYATAVLTWYVDQAAMSDDDLLTYRPAKCTGRPQPDVTAASIWMWRAATVLATEGVEAACTVTGRTNAANLAEILWHGQPIFTTAEDLPRPTFTL